jgi:hypothetical protein
MRSFYQDGLGTNIGIALQKRLLVFFFSNLVPNEAAVPVAAGDGWRCLAGKLVPVNVHHNLCKGMRLLSDSFIGLRARSADSFIGRILVNAMLNECNNLATELLYQYYYNSRD